MFRTLGTPVPVIEAGQAAELLATRYALSGRLSRLPGERDLNFLVETADARRYLLKFANASEEAGVTDFQNRLLMHLADVDSAFPAPRVVPTRDGEHLFETVTASGDVHRVRLLTWLDGTPLDEATGGTSVAAQTGGILARLGRLLEDFDHPSADYALPWDIHNAAALGELLPHVDDAALRAACERRIDRFRASVEPRLAALARQVVHNDMNPSNVLVDDAGQVAGVIDFGDAVRSERVNDVAVAAAYLCRVEGDPFAAVVEFLAAYAAVAPLEDEEVMLLPDLILSRHLTTVMIAHWRSALYPENRSYILRSERRARHMLETVANQPLDATLERFRSACSAGAARRTG